MRYAVLLCWLLTNGLVMADEITLKNGRKLQGNIQGLKDGQLDVSVFSMYVAGHPA